LSSRKWSGRSHLSSRQWSGIRILSFRVGSGIRICHLGGGRAIAVVDHAALAVVVSPGGAGHLVASPVDTQDVLEAVGGVGELLYSILRAGGAGNASVASTSG